MKTNKHKIIIMVLFILLGITVSFAQQKVKTFNIGNNGRIEVNINYGGIKIDTWGKSEVSVKYEEDEYAGSSFRIIQNGNTLTITSGENPDEDLLLSVPSSVNLDLNTDGGDIKINGNITGKVECSTAGGDIETKDITGNVSLSTAGGEVKTGRINGDASISSGGGELKLGIISGEAKLNTGGGNIKVSDVKKDLNIMTGGGNVYAGNVEGALVVTTGGGNVDAKKVSSAVTVTTGGGNISVGSSVGKAKVTSGGGNLTLKDVTGGVKCYTGSGNVYVELKPDPKISSKIKSGSGNATLYIPATAKATITAKVRDWDWWGEKDKKPITSDFPVSSENKSDDPHFLKTTYVINGGGSEIEIETTSGEIHIKRMK
jgi:hypothetical protein